MAVIKICNHYLISNYKKEELREKFEEELGNFIEGLEQNTPFDLDFFIEELLEIDEEFELLLDIDKDDMDIEYTEEQIDEFVENRTSSYQDDEFYSTDIEGDI